MTHFAMQCKIDSHYNILFNFYHIFSDFSKIKFTVCCLSNRHNKCNKKMKLNQN